MLKNERSEITIKDNELYYSGLRGIMLSAVCSSLGVIFYVCIVKWSFRPVWDAMNVWPMWLWISSCAFLYAISFKFPFFVAGWSFRKYNPKLAKIFEMLSLITVGTFCSALYDCLDMMNTHPRDFITFGGSLQTFLVTFVIFLGCLLLFNCFSIAKTRKLST